MTAGKAHRLQRNLGFVENLCISLVFSAQVAGSRRITRFSEKMPYGTLFVTSAYDVGLRTRFQYSPYVQAKSTNAEVEGIVFCFVVQSAPFYFPPYLSETL